MTSSQTKLDEPPRTFMSTWIPRYLTGDKLLHLWACVVQGELTRATTRCPVTLTSATLDTWSTPTF